MKKRINKKYYVEILDSSGKLVTTYKANLNNTDDPNKILNNFFESYPQYRSEKFLTQLKVTDTSPYEINPEYYTFGKDILKKLTDEFKKFNIGYDDFVDDGDEYCKIKCYKKFEKNMNKADVSNELNKIIDKLQKVYEFVGIDDLHLNEEESEGEDFNYWDFDIYFYCDYWDEDDLYYHLYG